MPPITPDYPGVYIIEEPSGVRTITGVATSITAFLGRSQRGPVDDPHPVTSFADFERVFGRIWKDSQMSYAVKDFYNNGGSKALIVRLFKAPGGSDGHAKITVNNLNLETANPGSWGNHLKVKVDYDGINDDVAGRYSPLTKDDLFNLTVRDESTGTMEKFPNVSIKDGPRRIDQVLEEGSVLVRVQKKPDGSPDIPGVLPSDGADGDGTEGKDSEKLTADIDYTGEELKKTGLYSLEKADLFNLLCIPADLRGEDTPSTVYASAMQYCVKRRSMLIVDSPSAWGKKKAGAAAEAVSQFDGLNLKGTGARNAALFFPRVVQRDPLREGQLDTFVPCGIIAGIMARTDTQRGVWKAPAGIDSALSGIYGLEVNLTDGENGLLNPLGINCLRSFPVIGPLVWGSRTLRGADQLSDEYKYISVRRLALFMEESLYRGLQWVVFEPNDEPLWAEIRMNVGAFMHNLFRQGAFQGAKKDAYFVKCDAETTTQNDRNLGIVNIWVGFAPLKPAEFVILHLQQIAGQVQT